MIQSRGISDTFRLMNDDVGATKKRIELGAHIASMQMVRHSIVYNNQTHQLCNLAGHWSAADKYSARLYGSGYVTSLFILYCHWSKFTFFAGFPWIMRDVQFSFQAIVCVRTDAGRFSEACVYSSSVFTALFSVIWWLFSRCIQKQIIFRGNHSKTISRARVCVTRRCS